MSADPATGVTGELWFRTYFSRGAKMIFEFGDAPPSAASLRGSIVAADSRTARLIEGGTESPNQTLFAATGDVKGVSSLSSIFVPRLLYGLPICECADSNAWTLRGDEEVDGRKAMRVEVRPNDSWMITLWIDVQSELLRRAQIDRFKEQSLAGTTTIQFEDVQAE